MTLRERLSSLWGILIMTTFLIQAVLIVSVLVVECNVSSSNNFRIVHASVYWLSTGTDDPSTVQCVYKTENDCVMKFTYSEHPSGLSILTALKEPG